MPTISEPRTQFPAGLMESRIGETVADAVCAISRALMECHDGGLQAETKVVGGDLIARLYQLRQYTAGYVSFDDVAQQHGLRERFGSDASEATLDELISWPLLILAKVVRKTLH
jgi:hypothetical protein